VGAPAVRLRPTTAADLDWVLAAESHPENAPYVTQWTRAQHAEAIAHPDMRHFVLERAGDAAAVGYVILAGLTGAAGGLAGATGGLAGAAGGLAAEPGGIELRRIVVTEKRRGHGAQALHFIKKLAFDDLKARRLWLDVRPNNPGAKGLYEKEGFVVEGTAPDGLIILSITRKEGA